MARPMQYATTSDGVRIAYMSLGDGPPVVFASNIFGDLSAYLGGWPAMREGTDRAVSQGWRVILYDVRGMGFSDRNVPDVELAGRVLDVEAVVRRPQSRSVRPCRRRYRRRYSRGLRGC